MEEIILKATTKPIHLGMSSKGALYKRKREKKNSISSDNEFNLAIGEISNRLSMTSQKLQRKNIANIASFRHSNRNAIFNPHKTQKPPTLSERRFSTATPTDEKKMNIGEKLQKPSSKIKNNKDKEEMRLGFTWLRWVTQKQRTAFRIKNKSFNIIEKLNSENQYLLSVRDSPRKLMGQQISACSPMNRKLPYYPS